MSQTSLITILVFGAGLGSGYFARSAASGGPLSVGRDMRVGLLLS
jgi:hypothetical protein